MSPFARKTTLLIAATATVAALAAAGRAGAATVWAVGDGAVPGPVDERVGDLIARGDPDHFLYLGDVYETGTAVEFATHYDSAFGRFKDFTSPTPGNHEWDNRAVGYDPYWGPRVRQPDGGHYYSLDIAGWHVVSLNSEEAIGEGSRQLDWLRADLAARTGTCTVAFVHAPRYNAGNHPDATELEPAWRALEGHAATVLSGHDHNYQRFLPNRGITQFVVGTGGRARAGTDERDPRLARALDGDFGALRMNVVPGRIDWAFVSLGRGTLDSGRLRCNGAAAVTIRTPRSGRSYSRQLSRLAGALNGEGGPVRVTLVRRTRRGCRALTSVRFRRSSCSTRRSVTAQDSGGLWSYRLPRGARLRPGVHVLTARRSVAGGEVTDRARFRIR
jgi:hypothetical protein